MEIVLFVGIGILLGIVAGLVPGLHINTIAAFFLASGNLFSAFSPIALASCLVAMAIVYSILSFIPSILLGAPDSENVLSVLPGHRMLLDGEAMEAIKITAVGGGIALLVVIGLSGIILEWLPGLMNLLKDKMFYLLLFVSCVGIAFERNKFWAAVIFAIAGIFGLITLNGFENEVVFPALAGMFGISNLLFSLNENIRIPEQIKSKITLGKMELIKNSLLGTIAGAVVGVLPGIGGAQATFLVQQLNPKQGAKEFLVAHAAVNVSNTLFPLFVLATIGRTRSGIAVAIKELIGQGGLWVLLGTALIAGIIGIVLHLKIGIYLAQKLGDLKKESYRNLVLGVILFIVGSVFALNGLGGLLVLLTGTLIGILPIILGVRRAECMGYFVIPAIVYYAGITYL
ncbi:TPA: tripartite tricarboxylate transporter permease [archaeon]|nr:tripartite tricarboxylate transporter permease [Candidatus Naiadarchaeales archaeon SRR2090159.bin1288]